MVGRSVIGRSIAAFIAVGAAAVGFGEWRANGAVAGADGDVVAGVEPPRGALPQTADVRLHYVQQDGPESGNVRVELTPLTVPLTLMQARSAAQQAFLAALGEPGLGDNLKRIEVVVRLMPAETLAAGGFERIFVYLHKGGRDWTVLAPE